MWVGVVIHIVSRVGSTIINGRRGLFCGGVLVGLAGSLVVGRVGHGISGKAGLRRQRRSQPVRRADVPLDRKAPGAQAIGHVAAPRRPVLG